MSETSSSTQPRSQGALRAPRRPLLHRLALWLHGQAERFDLVPTEYGQEVQVDPADARSVAAEWLRQGKLWAAYNPEQVLALKVGAAVLGLVLVALAMLAGSIR